MDIVVQSITRPGIANLPSSSSDRKERVEELLHRDYVSHHCFMNAIGFHNHLAHQFVFFALYPIVSILVVADSIVLRSLLAAYDLGATTPLLQVIYDLDAAEQQPIRHSTSEAESPREITDDNWKQWLGQPACVDLRYPRVS
jgi:hypothetical protein